MNNWIDIIQQYLLAPSCLLCDAPGYRGRDLCQACHRSLNKNRYCCYRCGVAFAPDVSQTGLCGQCLSRTPAFDETHAPYIFDDTLRYLVSQLKFNRRYAHARLLGTLLAETLIASEELPELIIPVPLHRSRYYQRGFNQSIEIAKTVARQLHIPIDYQLCRRHRDTPQQSTLSAKQRRKNLRNAFSVTGAIDYQHIAIIDDVMTTGTTVNELANVLKKAGAHRVDVWVCARA